MVEDARRGDANAKAWEPDWRLGGMQTENLILFALCQKTHALASQTAKPMSRASVQLYS